MISARGSSICLAVVAMAGAIAALRHGVWVAGSPGAGLFPLLSALLLLVASIGSAMRGDSKALTPEPMDRARFIRYGAAVAAFAFLLKPLGTIAATVGLLVVVLRGIERRSWTSSLSVALVAATLSWGLFKYLLGVPLPEGVLGLG